MDKVILMQSDRLKKVQEVANSGKVVAQNNASVISGALGSDNNLNANPSPVAPSFPGSQVNPQMVNMEDAKVNLNPETVVNPGLTDQIFGQQPSVGASTGVTSLNEVVNAFVQPSEQPNMFDVPSSETPAVSNDSAVTPETVVPQNNVFDTNNSFDANNAMAMNQGVVQPESAIDQSASQQKVIPIDKIVALRNEIDEFSDKIHNMLDELQEDLVAPKNSNNANIVGDQPTASTLIDGDLGTDLSKTVVIPTSEITNARNAMEQEPVLKNVA